MLSNIIERGSTSQRRWAIKTLRISDQFRKRRSYFLEEAQVLVPHEIGGKERMVYNANEESVLPGELARAEGASLTGDAAVDEAYDGMGLSYDLFSAVYKRNSCDGMGMRLDATVHYQKGYDNAFWNGEQLVFGDGDEDQAESERLFNRFTIAPDIIGHELTHGVTQYEARLVYSQQPGALNEAVSDIFGSLVKQRALNQTAAEADWIIGEGIFTSRVNGSGIRSLKAPGTAYDDPVLGKDPQPAHMDDYVNVAYDNGGVHINSSIPNHAFYVMAAEIGGYAWEKAGMIWYKALCDKFQVTTNFQSAAWLTAVTAGELYGKGSLEQQAVIKGWAEVGIPVEASSDQSGCLAILLNLIDLLSKLKPKN
ncbi:MAG: M4 family metallopeptidase [Anaerolineales bacterium]|nr:M4 family metallopeptidase [Anaerolineales bacterium]